MKLKYYLRGLGTGIAVTALIIGISGGVAGKKPMTDEEVKARAKELGMVERSVLSEMETASKESQVEESRIEENLNEESQGESKQPEESRNEAEDFGESEEESDLKETVQNETQQNEPEEASDVKTVPEIEIENEIPISEEGSENANEQINADSQTNAEPEIKSEKELNFGMPDEVGTINIQIVRGDSSDNVSRRLAEAGLVDNAINYDSFLCRNGYDKKIQTGSYEIPANATEEEIARMITSR